MQKRIAALLLALVLLAGLFPEICPTAEAAAEDTLESVIASQFDAYAAKLYQANSANDAIDQLLKPAIYGNGSTQKFGEKDALTAAIYNSALFREYIVECLPKAVEFMQSQHLDKARMGGELEWHDYVVRYIFRAFVYHESADTSEEVGRAVLIPWTNFTGDLNKNDQAMVLMTGAANCYFLIKPTRITRDQITYHLEITVTDTFDFSTNYQEADKQGFNTAYTKLLNLMGKLLKLKTFQWRSVSGFDITVPNTCSHTGSSNYRWENIGNELVSVSGEGLAVNNLRHIPYDSPEEGKFDHYYQLENTAILHHSQPWTVEICMLGGCSISLSPTSNFNGTELPAIWKRWDIICGLETEPYYKRVTGEGRYTYYKRYQHGLLYTDYGIKNDKDLVLRLENRVAEDGSNQVWLYANGEEVGPMTGYSVYDTQTSLTTVMTDDPSWFNGQDFYINYIFGEHMRTLAELPVHYVEIRSGGDAESWCVSTSVTEATCTTAAVETSRCKLCGGEWTREISPALGHTEEILPGTAASCTETGLTDSSKCSVCGETLRNQETIPTLAHTEEIVPGKAASCTEPGISDGKRCSVCGETLLEQENLEITAHSYGEWTVTREAGCTADGQEQRTCTACGHCETRAIPAAGHTEATDAAAAPSCTVAGKTQGTHCSACGAVLTAPETIPATGHTEVTDTGVSPTCIAEGLTEGTHCSVCSEILTAQAAIPATGHGWDSGSVTTEPTAEGDGIRTYTCTLCQETRTEPIHRYTSAVTAPTCTAQGCTTHTCPCGASYVDSYTAATGHRFGPWYEAAAATETEPAQGRRDCMICAYAETGDMPGEGTPLLWGDVNGDGFVDSYDAALILKYDVMLIGDSDLDLAAADVSGDGFVDSYDASLILKYDVMLIHTFPAEK